MSSMQEMTEGSWRLPVRRAPLHWFRGTPNFGDLLSPLLFEEIFGLHPIWTPASYSEKVL